MTIKRNTEYVIKKGVAYDILNYLSSYKISYPSKITRNIDRTPSAVNISLQLLLKFRLIDIKMVNKRKFYYITKRGRSVVDELSFIFKKVEK